MEILRFPLLLQCVFRLETFDDIVTLRRLISLAMAALIPFDSLGTTGTFSAGFLFFIVIPFVVEISELTIHISESRLMILGFGKTERR